MKTSLPDLPSKDHNLPSDLNPLKSNVITSVWMDPKDPDPKYPLPDNKDALNYSRLRSPYYAPESDNQTLPPSDAPKLGGIYSTLKAEIANLLRVMADKLAP